MPGVSAPPRPGPLPARAPPDARTETTRDVSLLAFGISSTPMTEPGSDIPLHGVTWIDAIRWCVDASLEHGLEPAYTVHDDDLVDWRIEADGFRLPTEAEWEWACRAGTTGPTYGELDDIAWTAADGLAGPQPVAGKAQNDLGLFDMLGNVWEWCWDLADPARYADYRSMRGGGWADRAWSVRASVRRGSAPDAVLEDVGFRVVRGAAAPGSAAAPSVTMQGWSADDDEARGSIAGPLPFGWTPRGRTPRGRTPRAPEHSMPDQSTLR